MIYPNELQESRRDNYVIHLEARARIKAMPAETQNIYESLASVVPAPTLDKYGNTDLTTEQWQEVLELAVKNRIEPRLLNPWYITEQGWEKFQSLWQGLPE